MSSSNIWVLMLVSLNALSAFSYGQERTTSFFDASIAILSAFENYDAIVEHQRERQLDLDGSVQGEPVGIERSYERLQIYPQKGFCLFGRLVKVNKGQELELHGNLRMLRDSKSFEFFRDSAKTQESDFASFVEKYTAVSIPILEMSGFSDYPAIYLGRKKDALVESFRREAGTFETIIDARGNAIATRKSVDMENKFEVRQQIVFDSTYLMPTTIEFSFRGVDSALPFEAFYTQRTSYRFIKSLPCPVAINYWRKHYPEGFEKGGSEKVSSVRIDWIRLNEKDFEIDNEPAKEIYGKLESFVKVSNWEKMK